LGFGQRLS